MSIPAALMILDAEIESLQAQLNSKRPDRTSVAFLLLRAKSLGRSLLRDLQARGLSDLAAADMHYKQVRRDVLKLQEEAE